MEASPSTFWNTGFLFFFFFLFNKNYHFKNVCLWMENSTWVMN